MIKYKKRKKGATMTLSKLSDYIDDITQKTKLSENVLNESKHEQKNI